MTESKSAGLLSRDEREEYLIYHVNEGLSTVSAKSSNQLSFISVGEDGRDQIDSLFRREMTTNQPFPRWNAAARTNRSARCANGSRVELTNQRKFAAQVDVGGLPDSNIVVSMPIKHPSHLGGSGASDVHRS